MIRRLLRLPLLLLLAVLPAGPGAPHAQDTPVLVGRVTRVSDGDTIHVQLASGPIRVRLHGIDAPESDQPGGREATAALAALVAGREVELDVVTQDRYERLVARVLVDGLNVNERLVKDGHAWAFRRYLRKREGEVCAWEAAARSARRGLWSRPPEDWIYPSDWRRAKRGTATVEDFSQETAARCIAALGRR